MAKKRSKIRVNVGCDFIDYHGTRTTSFQLVANERAVAVVDFFGDDIERVLLVDWLEHSKAAITRLAIAHRKRQSPRDYSKSAK